MGAAIAIPLLTIILISLGYALWALFRAGTEAFTFAKSARRHGSGETAPHYEPGDHQHVSTKPPGPEGQEVRGPTDPPEPVDTD